MSSEHKGGQAQPTIDREEHRSVNGVNAKAVVPYAYDGTNLVPMQGSLVPDAYDSISVASNSNNDVYTYKLSGVTTRTVTITYTGTDKTTLVSIVRA